MKQKKRALGQNFLRMISILLIINLIYLSFPGSSLALDEEGGATETPAGQAEILPDGGMTQETADPAVPDAGLSETDQAAVPDAGASDAGVLETDQTADSQEISDTAGALPGADDPAAAIDSPAAETASSTPLAADNFPVQAAPGDPLAVNSDTGADSSNSSSVNSDTETNVTNNNTANTVNHSLLLSETGSNDASHNTGSGIITTEKASGKGGIINVINRNQVNVAGNPSGPVNAGNAGTGAGSDNLAEVNVNNQLAVKNVNDSDTVNELAARVSSGNNAADKNTGHGIVLTGDANMGLNFITMANTNLVGNQKFYADWQNVYGNYAGNVDLSAESATAPSSALSGILVNAFNDNTGADSNNQVVVGVNDQVSVSNQNKGKINNHIDAEVVSGKNTASSNTGSGSVTTGSVNSAINNINFLNSNIVSSNWWLKSLNVFGDWNGDIRLPRMKAPNLQAADPAAVITANADTGAGSENTAEGSIENTVTVDNQNTASITNAVNIITDTGNNDTSYNGGSGVVKFGDVKSETNEVNVANQNITGDSWWTVIVNKFGDWSGTTVGSPEDMQVNSSENATVLSPVSGGVAVRNNSTGPSSNNDIGVNINHSTDIDNENDADITNTIDLKAISGENISEHNSGHGYIDAGNVRAVNNIINFANMNVTVGNWLVTVVNVFGRWTGNLVFDNDGGGSSSGEQNAGLNGTGTQAAANAETGAGSDNSASSSVDNNTDIANNNNSNTNNNTDASSVSGQNQASFNTGNGIVSTGGADTTSNIGNDINNNQVNVGQCPPSDSAAANAETGAGSDNDSAASSGCDTDITSDNSNSADNNLTADNTTGNSASNYNTGNGVIDTGWAETYVDLYNQQNENKITVGEVVGELEGEEAATPPSSDQEGDNSASGNGQDNGNGNTSDSGGGSSVNTSGASSGGSGGNSGSSGGGGRGSYVSSPAPAAEAAKPVIFDLNGDGKVDEQDYLAVFNNWKKENINPKLDPNGDGIIDDYDLSVIMANWNRELNSTL